MDAVLQALNQILPDLLYLLATILIAFGVKLYCTWQPELKAWYESHVNEKTRQAIADLGQEAFVYAETVFRGETGAEKLNKALAFFNQHMSRYGLSNLTADVIRAAIEKAWLTDKRLETPVIELATAAVDSTATSS